MTIVTALQRADLVSLLASWSSQLNECLSLAGTSRVSLVVGVPDPTFLPTKIFEQRRSSPTWLTPRTACAGQLRTHSSRGIVGYSFSDKVTCVLTDCHCMASRSKSHRSTFPLLAALSGSTALSSTTVCRWYGRTDRCIARATLIIIRQEVLIRLHSYLQCLRFRRFNSFAIASQTQTHNVHVCTLRA